MAAVTEWIGMGIKELQIIGDVGWVDLGPEPRAKLKALLTMTSLETVQEVNMMYGWLEVCTYLLQKEDPV